MKTLKCDEDNDITLDKFKKPNKDVLVKHLFDAFHGIVTHYKNDFLSTNRKIEKMKSEMINAQKSVIIQLQEVRLDKRIKELDSVQRTMKTTVESTVQAEFQSYSAVVSKHSPSSAPTFTPENLKNVVRNVVSEEDRSRNVLTFGLKETDEEKLYDKVDVIGEKPRFEAVQVGRKSSDNTRSAKVSLGYCSTVHQIFLKAKNLRQCQDYKTVFISPDRSPEDRAIHRRLVLEMKQKAKEDPNKHYYIRSGNICCEQKVLE